jgi:hypothetical protein
MTLLARVRASANTLVWMAGVSLGMTTKSFLNVSTRLATRLSARDVDDMGTSRPTAVFQTMLQA